MSHRKATVPDVSGTLHVLHRDGRPLLTLDLPYMTRQAVEWAAGESRLNVRRTSGFTPLFRLTRNSDGTDITAQWVDILGD